jgi:hypothetical protein
LSVEAVEQVGCRTRNLAMKNLAMKHYFHFAYVVLALGSLLPAFVSMAPSI